MADSTYGETRYLDVSEMLVEQIKQLDRQRTAERKRIKKLVLPRIRENADLRILDLEALDNNKKVGYLRQRTEEVVRFELEDIERDPNLCDDELLIKEILDEALGLGPLEDLLADSSVTEIMVNGPDRIFVERTGVGIEKADTEFHSLQALYNVIERIVAPIGRRVDESSPYVDGRLVRDGSRVHIIIPPLALSGPTITIRKFTERALTHEDLIGWGAITQQAYELLALSVREKRSIAISGGTGSGKTTLLNILSWAIPDNERIITIEDAAELRLNKLDLVTLESRKPNVEGKGEVTIRDLVRNALRMRPDRIVVGECRGAEALDMLQAMNTGHEGSLTTIHANTPKDMLLRLENLVLEGAEMPISVIRQNIASAIDMIVQVSRFRDKSRKISKISEVVGYQDGEIQIEDIYTFQDQGSDAQGKVKGRLLATGYRPTFLETLKIRGVPINDAWFEPEATAGTPRPESPVRQPRVQSSLH